MFDSNACPPGLLVVSRFDVAPDDADEFAGRARAAIDVLSACAGFIDAELGQSTDDPRLRVIAVRWTGIGAYRRALSSFDVKVTAVPLLSISIDEPSAYEVVHVRDASGVVEATSGLAADSESARLGEAAGPSVPGVVA